MPRARNIKPGFFRNETLADLHPLARILFAGLWTIADREGRLEDRPKRIKSDVLPYDNCNVDRLLQSLHDAGFIDRYEVSGNRYIQISTWGKHQNPHIKEVPSTIPARCSTGACTGNSGTSRADSGFLIPDSGFSDSFNPVPGAGHSEAGVSQNQNPESGDGQPIAFPPRRPEQEFNFELGFQEFWSTYHPKGQKRFVDSQKLYFEAISPDPWRLHEALMAPIRPGGKWAESADWKRGYVSAMADYIRNRRDIENPERYDPNSAASQKSQKAKSIEAAKKSIEEADLENVEPGYR